MLLTMSASGELGTGKTYTLEKLQEVAEREGFKRVNKIIYPSSTIPTEVLIMERGPKGESILPEDTKG